MADRLVDVLRLSLLDPQQAGHAPVFGLACTLGREAETQQFGQVVFGLVTLEGSAAGVEQAAFAVQETLAQLVARIADREVDLHAGCGRRFAPGQQVVHAGGADAFEKCGADGAHQRALAGLVRARQQVQPGVEPGQLERLAELAQLFDFDTLQLHHAALPSVCRRSDNMPVNSASAWAAVAAASPSPCWRSRSSAITSPT